MIGNFHFISFLFLILALSLTNISLNAIQVPTITPHAACDKLLPFHPPPEQDVSSCIQWLHRSQWPSWRIKRQNCGKDVWSLLADPEKKIKILYWEISLKPSCSEKVSSIILKYQVNVGYLQHADLQWLSLCLGLEQCSREIRKQK